VYGHGKTLPAPKRVEKFKPNRVIYEDISEDRDVPTAPNVGVDDNTVHYDDPVLSRVRLRSYAATAGSSDQPSIDAVVFRSIRVGVATPEVQANVPSTLNVSTQTGCSHGLSDVMLDHIESYVRRAPKPWQTRKLLPRLFRLLPGHDPATLTVALMGVIRGARISAEVILEECAAQPPLRFQGRDVMMLEDRVVHLIRGSGSDLVV